MCTDLDGLEEVIRIEHYNTSGVLLRTQIILVNNEDVRYEAKKIWQAIHGGIQMDVVDANGKKPRFHNNNSFFQPDGWNAYNKGSYTKGGVNIPPLKGQLTVTVINGFYNFDYSPIVNKDDHYNKATALYTQGQNYDIGEGLQKAGNVTTAAGTGMMAAGVVCPLAAPLLVPLGSGVATVGSGVSLAGDGFELAGDLQNKDLVTAGGKLAFKAPEIAIGLLLKKTTLDPKSTQKVIQNVVGLGADQVQNAAFSAQEKPSATKITQQSKSTLQQIR